ncbi:hypothetical protein NM208_g8295 [Fusarium decemcellulare]|uniref:Uncharacterized protein n=1 Tax=Fusarium decemcellulare TaxID=57161 RepID=A0ACC1S5Z3_9HYPO|nr:hypothetical protein NM208_g8295 [Fusarium decemcellulare]
MADLDICSRAVECRDLFVKCLEKPGDYGDNLRRFEYRFLIWTSFLGVYAKGTSSLEHRLQWAPEVKGLVFLMLQVLKRNLEHVINDPGSKGKQPASMVDQTGPLYGMKGAIDRLHRIAATMQGGSSMNEAEAVQRFSSKIDTEDLFQVILAMIRLRFPSAQESLRLQLARSITFRRNYLLYQHHVSQKLAPPHVQKDDPDQSAFTKLIRYQRPTPQSQTLSEPYPKSSWKKTLSSTHFSKKTPSMLLKRRVHPRLGNYSEMESHSSFSRKPPLSGLYPARPQVAEGQKVLCPYCQVPLESSLLKDEKKWREHVDADLRPYVCLSEQCQDFPLSFINVEEWQSHMEENHHPDWPRYVHRVRWSCAYCPDEFFLTEDALSLHLSGKDVEFHPTVMSPVEISRMTAKGKRFNPREEGSCPLCGPPPWAESWTVDRTTKAQETDASPEVVDDLSKHIAGHLLYLACMSCMSSLWWDANKGEQSNDSEQATNARDSGPNPTKPSGFASDNDLKPPSINSDNDGLEELRVIIRNHMVQSADRNRPSHFLPSHALTGILTQQRVTEALSGQTVPEDQTMTVEHILNTNLVLRDPTVKHTTRRKLFIILVLVGKLDTIEHFVKEHIFDSDLPLEVVTFPRGKMTLKRCNREGKLRWIDLFTTWEPEDMRAFYNQQWSICAPAFYFHRGTGNMGWPKCYALSERTILPFMSMERTRLEASTIVYRVELYPGHFVDRDDWMTSSPGKRYFTVKELVDSDEEKLKQETRSFRQLTKEANSSVIQLLWSFSRDNRHYLVFPYPEGNLANLWEKHAKPPARFQDGVGALWFAKQCLGIAEALMVIHKGTHSQSQFGAMRHFHGDLKPANVIWYGKDYDDQPESYSLGVLKLPVLGLTTLYTDGSISQTDASGSEQSLAYQSPELDVLGKISETCDIWSLGCVLLEFVTWYVAGWEQVKCFQEARKLDDKHHNKVQGTFFNRVEIQMRPGAQEKGSVVDVKPLSLIAAVFCIETTNNLQMYKKLTIHENSSDFTNDLVYLIQDKILRMHPERRATSTEIYHSLLESYRECQRNPVYYLMRYKVEKPPVRTYSVLYSTSPVVPKTEDPDQGGTFIEPPVDKADTNTRSSVNPVGFSQAVEKSQSDGEDGGDICLPPLPTSLGMIEPEGRQDNYGQLCIIKPEPSSPPIVPPDGAYILTLPDEMLALIIGTISHQLKHDMDDRERKATSTYGDFAAMALVCHRFNRIAVPLLYTYINHLSDDGQWRQGRLHHNAARRRFHETLRARKELRLHCRRLVIEFGFSSPLAGSDFGSVAADYASWLVNTKIISTYGVFGFDSVAHMATNMLSTASRNMRQLESVSIFRQMRGGLQLHEIYGCLCDAPSSLVVLGINGCPSAESPDYSFNGRLLEVDISNRCPARSLHLYNMIDHPRVVETFVAWNLSVVADILAPHREHLRTLTIGKLCQPGLGNFDVSCFLKLEKLAVHPKDQGEVDPNACSRLQAPMLKNIIFTEYWED